MGFWNDLQKAIERHTPVTKGVLEAKVKELQVSFNEHVKKAAQQAVREQLSKVNGRIKNIEQTMKQEFADIKNTLGEMNTRINQASDWAKKAENRMKSIEGRLKSLEDSKGNKNTNVDNRLKDLTQRVNKVEKQDKRLASLEQEVAQLKAIIKSLGLDPQDVAEANANTDKTTKAPAPAEPSATQTYIFDLNGEQITVPGRRH